MNTKRCVGALAALVVLSLLTVLAPGEEAWAVEGQSPRWQSIPTLTHTPGPATATVEATETVTRATGEPAAPDVPDDAASTPRPAPTLVPVQTFVPSPASEVTVSPVATVEGESDEVSIIPQTPTAGWPAPSPTADWVVESTPFTSLSMGLGGTRCLGDLLVMGLGLLALIAGLALLRKREGGTG